MIPGQSNAATHCWIWALNQNLKSTKNILHNFSSPVYFFITSFDLYFSAVSNWTYCFQANHLSIQSALQSTYAEQHLQINSLSSLQGVMCQGFSLSFHCLALLMAQSRRIKMQGVKGEIDFQQPHTIKIQFQLSSIEKKWHLIAEWWNLKKVDN